MRSTVLFLLAVALLVGCFRSSGIENSVAKTNWNGLQPDLNAGDNSSQPSVTSKADATPQDLVDALKKKDIEVDLSPALSRDRSGAVASVLTLQSAGANQPPRVLMYLCVNEDMARELVGVMGDGAFASGRFAIGPYLRTSADQALAQKIQKAIDDK